MIAGFAAAASAAAEPPPGAVSSAVHETWYQYRWLIIASLAALLTQAATIMWLFFERRRRRIDQIELRQRLIEVIHLNRTATAGALSAPPWAATSSATTAPAQSGASGQQ